MSLISYRSFSRFVVALSFVGLFSIGASLCGEDAVRKGIPRNLTNKLMVLTSNGSDSSVSLINMKTLKADPINLISGLPGNVNIAYGDGSIFVIEPDTGYISVYTATGALLTRFPTAIDNLGNIVNERPVDIFPVKPDRILVSLEEGRFLREFNSNSKNPSAPPVTNRVLRDLSYYSTGHGVDPTSDNIANMGHFYVSGNTGYLIINDTHPAGSTETVNTKAIRLESVEPFFISVIEPKPLGVVNIKRKPFLCYKGYICVVAEGDGDTNPGGIVMFNETEPRIPVLSGSGLSGNIISATASPAFPNHAFVIASHSYGAYSLYRASLSGSDLIEPIKLSELGEVYEDIYLHSPNLYLLVGGINQLVVLDTLTAEYKEKTRIPLPGPPKAIIPVTSNFAANAQ